MGSVAVAKHCTLLHRPATAASSWPRLPACLPTGVAKAIAKALGKEAKIVLFDPVAVGTGKGNKAEGFPFRNGHFWASTDSVSPQDDARCCLCTKP